MELESRVEVFHVHKFLCCNVSLAFGTNLLHFHDIVLVSKKECARLIKEVDKDNSGEVDYREFCKTMIDESYEQDHDNVDKSSMLRKYASALRDNIGSSMQVKSNSAHLKVGAVNVGSGPASMQMYQRDVGDRLNEQDLLHYSSGATWGPSVRHTTSSEGLSLLEAAMRTPRCSTPAECVSKRPSSSSR